MKRFIGRLLHYANTSPPKRKRFYEMKERILRRYGDRDGFDVQHFDGKICLRCGGTGLWTKYEACWKCGGSGLFKRERWVVLDRWKLGGFPFHTIGEVSWVAPDPPITNQIEGYIEHNFYSGFAPDEAAMWLGLFFDRSYLWALLNEGSTYVRWPRFLGPMVQVKQVIGHAKRFRSAMENRCISCQRHLWSAYGNVCKSCNEEVPF